MNPALLYLAAVPIALPVPRSPVPDLKAPPGFAVYQFAGPELVNDISAMTIDPAGRVVVGGPGYIRVLTDTDGDGRADRAADLFDRWYTPKGTPMGLLVEGEFVYVVVDDGLWRYSGYNGKDSLKAPRHVLPLKATGEHDAHAIRRGPDGWLYLMCGNMAGVTKATIRSPRSPVTEPVAGTLLRVSPDEALVEVVADGFRNAYDVDFDPAGEPFTFDSDNERCVGLPWYEGCRFYHIVPGGNYGWRSPQLSQTWRKPPYFVDVVPPIADLGRGSPTGVACYRHTHFPARFRGGFFLADWTFGRVYFAPLTPKESSYEGTPEVFLRATGESGFAPTALAVHPVTGELFVSIGGRGTRGSVYRVRHLNSEANPKPIPMAKRSLDWSEEAAKSWLADATGPDALKRRQALELIGRWMDKPPHWNRLVELVNANLAHPDPLIRARAGPLAVRGIVPVGRPKDRGKPAEERLTIALAELNRDPDWAFEAALDVLTDPKTTEAQKLRAVRIVQLTFGDLTAVVTAGTVWEGYTVRNPVAPETVYRIEKTIEAIPFPQNPNLRREMLRLTAAFGPRPGQARFAITFSPDSPVEEDVHGLIVAARLGGRYQMPGFRLTAGLLALDHKLRRQGIAVERNWSLRMDELLAVLDKESPEAAERLLLEVDFGRPGHMLLARAFKLDAIPTARRFIEVAKDDPEYGWTAEQVRLLGALAPFENRPVLLKLWERGGLEDAILPVLAVAPEPADVPKFVVGLRSADPEVVRVSAGALAKLPAPDDRSDVAAAIRALRTLPSEKADIPTREALAAFLRTRTGLNHGADFTMWEKWFVKAYPDLAAKVTRSDGFDPKMWEQRAAVFLLLKGDAAAGRKAFVKAKCAGCHDGGRAIGPPLAGVGKRFGKQDLLTAILEPNKDVPVRYRPVQVITKDGRSRTGMLIYEATDGVILQTTADTTVRIAGDQIESRRVIDTSVMPGALLDDLTNREIADLLAYLDSLTAP